MWRRFYIEIEDEYSRRECFGRCILVLRDGMFNGIFG